MPALDLTRISLKQRLISGGFWAFVGKFASTLVNVLLSGLLTRLLDPEDVGAYFLIFSIALVGSTAGQLGLNQLVVRLIAEAVAVDKNVQLGPLIVRVIALTSTATLTIVLLLNNGLGIWLANHLFHSRSMATLIGLATLWMCVLAVQSIIAECFRGLHEIGRAVLFQGLASSTMFLVLMAIWRLLHGHATLSLVIKSIVFATIINIMISAMSLYRRLRSIKGPPDTGHPAGELLRQSWPIFITNIAVFFLSQTSIWVLGIFSNHENVALYGAAARLVTLAAMPLMIANAFLPPIIAELTAENKIIKLQRILRTTASLTLVPAVIVAICFTVFSAEILAAVFGEFYTRAAGVLSILTLGQITNIWAGSCGLTLIMTGHQRTMMIITLFAGLITVALSLTVVEDFGPTGIAVATATVLVFQNALMLYFARQKAGVWTHASISAKYLKTSFASFRE